MLAKPMATQVEIHQPRDPNTLANYNAWRMKHVTANLEIDFKSKRVFGNVQLAMQKVEEGDSTIKLDTRYVTVVLGRRCGHRSVRACDSLL